MRTRWTEREELPVEGLSSQEVRIQLQDYLARTGLAVVDFAHRINQSHKLLYSFLAGAYYDSAHDAALGAAIREFITAHPIRLATEIDGPLYETENVRLLRKYFTQALEHRRAYYVYGPPGTQKSFVLQHLAAELNGRELAKNGTGRKRAHYVYVRHGIRPLDLMKRIAEAVGAITLGTVDRILRNLRFDFEGLKVLLVFDEAQHLSIECLETVRELLDQPPHCGLLFAGSHELERIFSRQALELEQWKSRFHAGQALPGLSEEEAVLVVRSELGAHCPSEKMRKLIKKCRVSDLHHGGEYNYVSARRLFWALRDLKHAAPNT